MARAEVRVDATEAVAAAHEIIELYGNGAGVPRHLAARIIAIRDQVTTEDVVEQDGPPQDGVARFLPGPALLEVLATLRALRGAPEPLWVP